MAGRVPSLPLVLALALPSAFGAHPLQTEDTGTQGTGNIEIENGVSSARVDSATLTIWQPQVSAGLAPTLDAIVQPSVAWLRAPRQRRASGAGDTNVDAKWRFWSADSWSLAIRAGLQAPTSHEGLGLPRHRWAEHALLAVTWDAAPTTVHANAGVTRLPRAAAGRQTVGHLSAALMQALDERWILVVDSGLEQDPDPHASQGSGSAPRPSRRRSWPGSLLAGAIWTARPGLDLDVGYQHSVAAWPVNHQWTAGLTYRFAL